jgi:hypothetical protein
MKCHQGGRERQHRDGGLGALKLERESLAAPGAIAGTAAVRCYAAAPAITGATLLRGSLKNVTFTGRQLQTAS